jgi:hypothetical protein
MFSLSAKEAYHDPNVRILKLRNPDRPSLLSSPHRRGKGICPGHGQRKKTVGMKLVGIDKTAIYAIDKIVLVDSIAILRRR